ncbi:HAMP domain-containing sensor histidine kinase [Sporosarcina limicola]|uniref:histidine kinase n=1 Tax=Sporosarcina limicola TaxID=34101 RepID=A0A927MJ41_9BACL|nr:HAMP domain-containing sensor histidine kinase [Sporosarcina limicola]MBE1555340.1 signal transduction histidine kinase [Sporosarcina limicola]
MNKRIRKLNHALNQLNIYGDVIVLEDNAKDEIGQLTKHYNSMAQRIQNQATEIAQFESRRKQLLSNLSHDLRTPLTMILGYAETIRNGLYKDKMELQASAKIILQRSRYMDKLLDQLLDLTKKNVETLTLHLASHNVSEQLRKIVAEYLLFLDGQNYSVPVDIPDTEIEAFIDAELIERVIRNLLDNAVRYGKSGHYLGIILEETQHDIKIGIKDKGKGIELGEQEKIFERFYRADGSRKGEGLGIGLSIVKEIVELHHGSINLTSVPYEQTIFLITLPKN